MLNVTKAIEESADTFFYQVAYEMGIDRIHHWLSQFGYGQSTGIDLNEEYRGVLPSRDWKLKVHKKIWYQGIRFRWASAGVLGGDADPDGKSADHADQQRP